MYKDCTLLKFTRGMSANGARLSIYTCVRVSLRNIFSTITAAKLNTVKHYNDVI